MEQKFHINLMKLRGLMVEKGYTITSLAHKSGLAYGSLSRMLNGHFQPGYHFMTMIYLALDMTERQFLDIFFVRDD